MNITLSDTNTSNLGYNQCYFNGSYSLYCPDRCCYYTYSPYSPYCCNDNSGLVWLWIFLGLFCSALLTLCIVCVIQRARR